MQTIITSRYLIFRGCNSPALPLTLFYRQNIKIILKENYDLCLESIQFFSVIGVTDE